MADTQTFEVTARKFRPQTFGEVVGQEHITRTLQNSLRSGRVAHAFLFIGSMFATGILTAWLTYGKKF